MERTIEEIILDTDAFIELNKEGLLLNFIHKFEGYLTEISLYEYLRGRLYYGKNIEKEKNLIENMFTILSLNNAVILTACKLWNLLKKVGYTISDGDLLNSAIAIYYNMPISTNNLKHYQKLSKYGLSIIPWNKLKSMIV